MVRLTTVLARVPVIKFRKGGLVTPSAPSAAAAATPAAAPAAGASAAQGPQAVAMSTRAITDMDIPARYRRIPLTQEEIDTINGGGIV